MHAPWTPQSVYIVALATKSSSTCRTCERYIGAGNVRIGVIFQHPNGYVLIHWHHLTCWTPTGEPLTLRQMEGLELFETPQRQLIQRWLERQQSTDFV